MSKEKFYYAFLGIVLLLYVIVESIKPTPIDFRNDFTRYTSIPFGTEILFNEIETLFPEQKVVFENAIHEKHMIALKVIDYLERIEHLLKVPFLINYRSLKNNLYDLRA